MGLGNVEEIGWRRGGESEDKIGGVSGEKDDRVILDGLLHREICKI
jgi:hypothetical protein